MERALILHSRERPIHNWFHSLNSIFILIPKYPSGSEDSCEQKKKRLPAFIEVSIKEYCVYYFIKKKNNKSSYRIEFSALKL